MNLFVKTVVVVSLSFIVLTPPTLAQNGNVKTAKYHKMLQKRPSAGYLYERFYNSWLENDTSESLEIFLEDIVTKTPTANNKLLFAFFYTIQGKDISALALLTEAAKDNPDSADIWFYKAQAESRTLNFETAIADLHQTLKTKPTADLQTKTLKFLGKLYVRNGQKDEAAKVWQQLIGYVMTQAKPTSIMLFGTDSGDPLLAVRRYGLGMGLCYTSDMTERWGGEWLNWNGGASLWAQILRGIVRTNVTEGLTVTEKTIDNQWLLDIVRKDRAQKPINAIEWAAVSLTTNGQPSDLDINEIGLGRYQVKVPLAAANKITVRLHDQSYDKMSVRHFQKGYPSEYNLSRKASPLITARTIDNLDMIIKDKISTELKQPIGYWAYFAAFTSIFLGIVMRRI